jgi:hypothetical protein
MIYGNLKQKRGEANNGEEWAPGAKEAKVLTKTVQQGGK